MPMPGLALEGGRPVRLGSMGVVSVVRWMKEQGWLGWQALCHTLAQLRTNLALLFGSHQVRLL